MGSGPSLPGPPRPPLLLSLPEKISPRRSLPSRNNHTHRTGRDGRDGHFGSPARRGSRPSLLSNETGEDGNRCARDLEGVFAVILRSAGWLHLNPAKNTPICVSPPARRPGAAVGGYSAHDCQGLWAEVIGRVQRTLENTEIFISILASGSDVPSLVRPWWSNGDDQDPSEYD
jgi:hypothetical protein